MSITASVRAIAVCTILAGCGGPTGKVPINASGTQTSIPARAEKAKTLTMEVVGIHAGRVLDQCPECSRLWEVRLDREIRAFAGTDGKVHMTSGMIDFIRTPDEFAYVFGHELAHISQKHGDITKAARTIGALTGLLLLAPAEGEFYGRAIQGSGKDIEREADYLGMIYAARSGYDHWAALDVVTRMARLGVPGAEGSMVSDDADTRARNIVIMAREIDRLKAQGLPLRMERK